MTEGNLDDTIQYDEEDESLTVIQCTVFDALLNWELWFLTKLMKNVPQQGKKPKVFLQHLMDASYIANNFTNKDLDAVGKVVKYVTGKQLFPKVCTAKGRC